MMRMNKPIAEVLAFTALATLPIAGLGLVAASKGGLATMPAAAPLAMFGPALAAIVVQKASGGRVLGPDGLGWTCLGKVESSLEMKGELDDEAEAFYEGV